MLISKRINEPYITNILNDFQRYYGLTYPQMSIWNSEKVFPGTSFANIVGVSCMEGDIDYGLLESAINMAVRKNDGFRTRFIEEEGNVRQYFGIYKYFKVDFYDFSETGGYKAFEKWSNSRTIEPFKLIDSDLFYFALFKISEKEGGFYIKTHHLISDAWTDVSQIGSIIEYYSKLRENISISGECSPSYSDFIESEAKYLSSGKFEQHKKFWSEKFSTVPEFLSFKTKGTVYKNIKASRKSFVIANELAANIHKFRDLYNCSSFVVFMSALYAYISRITSKSDIVLGTPILNRTNAREKSMVGMFVNVMPMRFEVDCEKSFADLAASISKELLTLLRYQKYPYEIIQKEFRERHQVTENLCDVVLSYQNVKVDKNESPDDYKLSWQFNGYQTNSLQIHVSDWEDSGNYNVYFDYLEDVFNPDEIVKLSTHFINLLSEAVNNPSTKLCDLNILSESEKNEILYGFNDTCKDYPKDKTIQELIEIQVQKAPNNTAVEFNGKKLSYEKLNEKANSLADKLRKSGVAPDSIVGIMMDRSLELAVGILAILKAGGAYLPINPRYPAARINYILKDSGLQILLIKGVLKDDIVFEGDILDLEAEELIEKLPGNPVNINKPKDLAYVIYTSGSTGEPKGAVIEHRSLINFLYTMSDMYGGDFNEKDRCLSLTNISFDASVCEIFLPLVFGACLVLNNDEDYLDVIKLSEIIINKSISFTYIPPSMLRELSLLLGKASGRIKLNKLFVGAEPIKVSVMDEYLSLNPSMKILNGYGPTETTIVASFYPFTSGEDKESYIPIGKPINNTRIYILDKNRMPMPVDTPGELYVAGDGMARGYLNKPELTNERFVPNPYAKGKMYKTGDLAVWLPDGNIKFIGRIDNQVKIRGLRIELGEIESLLSKISCINEAVVLVRNDEEDSKYLCAYYTASETLSTEKIKSHLLKLMPEFMIPKYFIQVEEMPLTYNGKINKKLLPEPDPQKEQSHDFTPPSNQIEECLVKAWQKVLNVQCIGVKDNIFEYGVDSLTIMRMLVEIMDYGWNVTMQDFYRYRTIRELSGKIISNELKNAYEEVSAANKPIGLRCRMEAAENGRKRGRKNVLLTGATGFLGVHLLRSLLESTQTNIYCLIKGPNKGSAEKRLVEKLKFYFNDRYGSFVNDRIFVLCGDITCDRLGLSTREFEYLIGKIDTVIHTAAIVKHFGDYSAFEKTNVLGTQKMIEFCMSGGATLNYVSTISISGDFFNQKETDLRFTENDLFIGQNLEDNVYVKSKFEAEKLIFESVRDTLKASVFRLGNITGRYSDGHFQYNINENRFYNILKFMIQSETAPKEIGELEAEFTPVDLCADAIVKLTAFEANNLNVYHLFNDSKIKMKEVIRAFRLCGCNINFVESEQYKTKIVRIAHEDETKEMVVSIINDLYMGGTYVLKPSVQISSDITKSYLKKEGFEWQKPDDGYLEKVYGYMKKVGFIK